MSSREPRPLDGLIDEALESLTSGRPRTGFRGRVLARLAESPRPASVGRAGWRLRPFQLAAAGVVLACGLAAALIVPVLFPADGPVPTESETAASPSAVAPQPAVAASREAKVPGEMQAAELTPPPQARRRPAVRRAVDAVQALSVGDDSGTVAWASIDPLPDPTPVVNSAIEISPVEIQPLVIPEIQVPSLEAGGIPNRTGSGN